MSAPSSISKVIRDILDLVELQYQLLAVDAQKARRSCTRAIVCGAIAAVLLLPVITTLLLGIGFLIRELTPLSTGVSVLIVGSVVAVVMGVLALIGIKTLQHASAAMSESKGELVENIKWLKATLIAPSTSPRNQIRSESFEFPPYQTSVSSSTRGDQGWRSSSVPQHPTSMR